MKKIMNEDVEIQVEVVNSCNLKCKHCSSVIKDNKLEYNLSDLINFFKLFKNKLNIQLTGGEPTLNFELNNIIKLFKSLNNDVKVGIFSNGIKFIDKSYSFIPNDECAQLKLSGLDYCYFSIYHTENYFHDLITGVKNSLKYTTETINNFLINNITVKVHLIINKYNSCQINSIIDNLTSLGVSEIRLLKLVNTGEAVNNWHEIGVSYIEQSDIVHNILKNNMDKQTKNITISGFPEIIPCRPVNKSSRCQAGNKLFYITYDGNLYPCACTRNFISKKIAHVSNISLIKNYFFMNSLSKIDDTNNVYCRSV